LATLKTETPRLLACCKRHLKIGSNCPPQQQQEQEQQAATKFVQKSKKKQRRRKNYKSNNTNKIPAQKQLQSLKCLCFELN